MLMILSCSNILSQTEDGNSTAKNSIKYSKISWGKGIVIAGEFFSPLKMLHFAMGPVNTVYFLMEYPEKAGNWLSFMKRLSSDALSKLLKVV